MTKQAKQAKREQEAKWQKIENEISAAFTHQPRPDMNTLNTWIEKIEQVRPEFRATLARMLSHQDCY